MYAHALYIYRGGATWDAASDGLCEAGLRLVGWPQAHLGDLRSKPILFGSVRGYMYTTWDVPMSIRGPRPMQQQQQRQQQQGRVAHPQKTVAVCRSIGAAAAASALGCTGDFSWTSRASRVPAYHPMHAYNAYFCKQVWYMQGARAARESHARAGEG